MDEKRRKHIANFKAGAERYLLTISQKLTVYERNPTDSDAIKELFRAAHTLKGDANMLGFKDISRVAHKLEDIFGEFREGNLKIEPAITDRLFEVVELLGEMSAQLEADPPPTFDTANIEAQLAAILRPDEPATAAFSPAVMAPSVQNGPALAAGGTTIAKSTASPANLARFREEAHAQLLTLSQRLVSLERDPQNAEDLKEIFRAAHTLKGNSQMMGYGEVGRVAHEMEEIFAQLRDGQLSLQPAMTDVIFEAISFIETAVARGETANQETDQLVAQLARLSHREVEPRLTSATPPSAAGSNGNGVYNPAPPAPGPMQTTLPPARDYSTLTVDVTKLDELVNITSELVLSKMEAESTLNNLRTILELLRVRQRVNSPVRNLLAITDRDPNEVMTMAEVREALFNINEVDVQVENLLKNTFRETEEHTSHLQNTVDELENNVLSIRMLPIATLYEEFVPSVRVTARQVNKRSPQLIQTGGEIELDKKVLDGIKNPINHLIRNALDHGIEASEERKRLGKPEEGRLTMAATQEGGYVFLHISDDGAGIDPQALRKRAVEKGFMSETRANQLGDDEILNVIYEPRFSTAKLVTDTSGRGVGMDVVKTYIERLGGSVSVQSTVGQGTTFILKVPLSLARSRALLVRLEDQIYALPAPNIEAMLYLTPDDVMSRSGREVVLHRDMLVPLVRMADLLGQTVPDHPVFNYQQMQAERVTTSMTSSGLALTRSSSNGFGEADGYDEAAGALVGLTLADPEAQLRIQRQRAEQASRSLKQFTFERLPGVVVGSGDRRFCLVVDELVDEIEIVVKSLSERLLKARHINSATILGDGRVVLILDVPNLISTARDTLAATNLRGRKRLPQTRKRILVVDDSITTRELEKSILEAANYEVDLADDGTVALEILERDSSYDLVISDVEMPRMDGFELTASIKAHPTFRRLPVIIVSSLDSDTNKRKGINAGAQAYITKGEFNQNNLLDTIEYLTS